MKKELKDFIHLYLGCDVLQDDNEVAKFVGIYAETCMLIHKATEQFGECDISLIKPILRPLSDMTEEEENKIVDLCLDSSDFIITYRGMGYNFDGHEIHESVKCLKVEIFCEFPIVNNWIPFALIQIDSTDNRSPIILGWFEELGKELKDDLLENYFELTRYLLYKQFDLFGLIESRRAIDKTTLK